MEWWHNYGGGVVIFLVIVVWVVILWRLTIWWQRSVTDKLGKERFITAKDIEIHGLTTWAAPFTGGFKCVIPKGTTIIAYDQQVPGAEGFAAIPENYEELESLLVPESDRSHYKYTGYYFVFPRKDIGDKLIPVR